MPLNLVKRGEKTSPITAAEHDSNMTAVENMVTTLESTIATINTTIASLTTTAGTKLANVSEDTNPALGGDLDGANKEAWNVRGLLVSKSAAFTVSPTEAAIYNITAASAITVTLPSSLTTCPVGTVFEFHITNNIQVTFATSNANNAHIVNANGHRKLTGPEGTGYARVIRSSGSDAIWKLVGNTVA